jgi:hypothetical protein
MMLGVATADFCERRAILKEGVPVRVDREKPLHPQRDVDPRGASTDRVEDVQRQELQPPSHWTSL